MRKIPQVLLKAQHESLKNQLDYNISQKLDQSITELYTQALKHVEQRVRQKKISADVNAQPSLIEAVKQRLLIEELRVSLSQIFSHSNLLDMSKYTILEQSIQHWCPWSIEVQKPGPLVKQLLIEMLPDARQLQQLKNICADYKTHLTTKIEIELKSQYPKVYQVYQAQSPQVFGGPTLKNGLQTQASFDPCQPMDRFLNETASKLKNSSISLQSAMDNFQAVRRLEITLENPIKPVTKQLQEFRHQFKVERIVIEKNPDSAAVQFIKNVLDYLSRGWIYKLGFWRVRGQEASQQIQQTLNPAMPISIPALY